MNSSDLFFLSKEPKNWAEEAAVRERIRQEIVPLLARVRDRRRPLNDMWASLWRTWTLEHETPAYRGRSNIYVPAAKKVINILTSQTLTGTFPSSDVFGVKANDEEHESMTADVKGLLETRLDKAKIRSAAEPFYRQLHVTGNSPLKVHHVKKTVKQVKRKKGEDDKFSTTPEETTIFEGPVADVVPVFNLYVWPENINDLSQASMVFEDVTHDRASLIRLGKERGYVDSELKAIGQKAVISNREVAESQMLAAQGMVPPSDDEAAKKPMVDTTEVWLDFDPLAVSFEEESNPVPFLITVSADGKVLRAIENPYADKRPPYLWARIGKVPGRFYGTGDIEGIQQMQVLLNDQTNQSMDCATWVMNPFVLYNSNSVNGAMPELEPGVAVDVSDVSNSVKFERPPVELIQAGSVMLTQTNAWINDFSGAPPVLQGGAAPGRGFKTATGIGTANQNARIPLQEIIRGAEEDVWQPLLGKFYMLDQQFGDEEVLVKLTNGEFKRLSPQELWGDYCFSWFASTQMQNLQVKAGQMTQFLQVLTAPTMAQMLAANGVKPNPVPIIRKLYVEVLGFRDVDEVLVKMQPGEGAGPPGGQPGAPSPGGPPPMSPDDSLNGAQPELENSPEFSDLRVSANELAAQQGLNGVSFEE